MRKRLHGDQDSPAWRRRSAGVAVVSMALLGGGVSSAGTSVGWSIQATPNPAAESLLNGVSCSSPSACTAVGTFVTDSQTNKTLAARWDGRRWTRQATPDRVREDSVLIAVSCPRATDCVAVGSAGDDRTLAERWSRNGWHIQASGSGRSGFLLAVSCSSPWACTAVGSAGDGQKSLAERWNGTRWTVQHLRSPGNSTLTGVSCPSATDCTAVGNAGAGGGKTFAELWARGGWVRQRTASPAGIPFLDAVSCSSPDACTAVGFDETVNTFPVKTLVERWNGRRWTLQSAPSPPGLNVALTGVSCPATSACVATGYDETTHGLLLLAERWNGNRWAVRRPSAPNGRGPQFNGVSCSSAADCTAVGYYLHGPDDLEQTLAERYRS